jgi:hypothetical protein
MLPRTLALCGRRLQLAEYGYGLPFLVSLKQLIQFACQLPVVLVTELAQARPVAACAIA